jgi:hypothetical protein
VAMRAWSHLARALLLGAATLASGQTPIAGPVLGYLWDAPAGRIRPVLGVPGSATLGEPLALAGALRRAEIASGQAYALAVDDAERVVLVNAASGDLRALDVAAAGLDRIVFSPSGAAAALYYTDVPRAVLLTGLPGNPVARAAVDLSGLPALITAIAASDQDELLLFGTAQGVYLTGPRQSSPALVAPATTAGAIAFLENSRDALVADRERNEILWIRDVTGAAERVVVASEKDGVLRPVAIAAAEGNRKAIAALPGAVAVFDLNGGPPVITPCACSPSGLVRMRGNSVFRLNDGSAGPLFLAEPGGPDWRVVFVPGLIERRADGEAPAAFHGSVARGRSRP